MNVLHHNCITGPFIAGPMADKWGRKITLLISSIFFLLSYILLVTTKSVGQIYAARLIQGLGVGFVMTAQPMYIGEIASDDCRGAVGSFMQLFIVGEYFRSLSSGTSIDLTFPSIQLEFSSFIALAHMSATPFFNTSAA